MEDKISAVIVGHSPGKNETVIVTAEYGLLYLRFDKAGLRTVVHGQRYILYGVQRDARFVVHHALLLDAIPSWFSQDLIFLHHILELYRMSVPFSAPSYEVYELLQFLFSPTPPQSLSYFKKLFIGSFFARLGLVPEEPSVRDTGRFIALISRDADSMFESQEDCHNDAQLAAYVRACYEAHPYAHRLKTRPLAESGLL